MRFTRADVARACEMDILDLSCMHIVHDMSRRQIHTHIHDMTMAAYLCNAYFCHIQPRNRFTYLQWDKEKAIQLHTNISAVLLE